MKSSSPSKKITILTSGLTSDAVSPEYQSTSAPSTRPMPPLCVSQLPWRRAKVGFAGSSSTPGSETLTTESSTSEFVDAVYCEELGGSGSFTNRGTNRGKSLTSASMTACSEERGGSDTFADRGQSLTSASMIAHETPWTRHDPKQGKIRTDV